MQQTTAHPLGRYLINRLHTLGVHHAFGIPGDYVLGLFRLFEESPIQLVGATSELCAAYAADAYARLSGLGVALATYGAGGFSMANAIACAFAERSAVVLISGAPGIRERKRALKRGELLHHTVGGYETQHNVFAQLTCARAVLDDPRTAFQEIDRVLDACLYYKRPVYIEIPRDRIDMLPDRAPLARLEERSSDPRVLAEAAGEAVAMLRASRTPVLIAGVEVARFRLQQAVLDLAEAGGIPMAAMALSKSVLPEQHALYAGVYQAAYGLPEVTRFVEESDCLLMLGTMLTDFDTGVFSHNLEDEVVILAVDGQVRIGRHHFRNVRLADFVRALTAASLGPFDRVPPPRGPESLAWQPQPDTPVTVRRLIQKVNACLNGNTVLLADPGETLLMTVDLRLPPSAEFHAPAFYVSLGWAVPAAIGAQLARPERRPLVLVGDGAFQMTGTELATAHRHGLCPVVVILNNDGYQTERFLCDGTFNEIPEWNYHRLSDYLGAGRGFDVRTEDQLEAAFASALADRSTYSVLNVRVRRDDYTPASQRLVSLLARRR